jgi:hypothetical protein
MTREEAKAYIIRHCNPDYPNGKTEWDTAMNMAIEALRREPGEDVISRKAALALVTRSVEAIRHLPSAEPEIVRCGQCKYAEVADKEDAQDGYTCQFHRGSIWFSGSYCSWGERREE